jgi:hypothetical protein
MGGFNKVNELSKIHVDIVNPSDDNPPLPG